MPLNLSLYVFKKKLQIVEIQYEIIRGQSGHLTNISTELLKKEQNVSSLRFKISVHTVVKQ